MEVFEVKEDEADVADAGDLPKVVKEGEKVTVVPNEGEEGGGGAVTCGIWSTTGGGSVGLFMLPLLLFVDIHLSVI